MPRTDDVSVSSQPFRCGRRFTLDVAEEALARMVPAAVEHVALRLAETVMHRHGHEIEAAVHSYLLDRTWAEPIIREAIRESVHVIMASMLSNSRLADALNALKEGT